MEICSMELLSAIMIQTKCEKSSELKELPPERKRRLAKLIEERVPSGLATLEEWNEVISCFQELEPETDNKRAKQKLLAILREEESEEEPVSVAKNKWWEFKNKQ